ncbi:hypothetical protein M3182_04600 [Mesobacillus maritimus]|uniref:sodium:solute symporter family transporter n=1 Tax=Mesobacillus maritimus TaxID=1643336 RepID=UPI002042634A|nr:hypothetical protein [Mesobacillus maritimus]MCM3585025.1 hypothetical protein [Mesobacillus maritimus]
MNIPWANVLIILLLGALFIISSWFISRKVSSADEYIGGRGKLGVAFGTTSLLAFWITGNTIMAGPEAAYNNGILGALGYAALGGFAVVAFAPLARRIHQIIPHGRTVGDFFKNRFDRKSYYLFLAMAFVWVFGFLMTQGIGGGLLLEQIFEVPYALAVILTFIIVILYSTMGGFASVTGIAFFQVMLILIVVIVVPPLVYLTAGVTPVYEGMSSVAPESLDLLVPAGLLFLFAAPIVGIGEVFMDNTFWQRAYAIRKDKVVKIFSLAGVGWFFVPIAVATLAFVAIGFQHAPDQVNQVAPFIAKVYGGQFANWAFLVGVWAALASTIAALINALVSLVLNDVYLKIKPNTSEKHQLKFVRVATVVIGIVAMLFSLPQLTSMLQMLMFLGVVNAAFIFPIMYGLFWKRLNTNMSFAAAILAIIVGYSVYYTVGDMQGIISSGWVSFLVCWVGSLIKPANFDWEILRRVGLEEGAKTK